MKIVCIGNSIVNGFPHKRSQCFVSLWRQSSGNEIINKGANGDITSNIYSRFEKDVISHRPVVAVVLTGTNDFIYQLATPEEVLDYMDKMAILAKSNHVQVIFMTPLLIHAQMAQRCWIPDIDYHSVNKNLTSLRSLMIDYGDKNGVKIIDAQEQFFHLYTEDNAAQYLHDGLHPTLLGHEAIAGFFKE